MLFAVVFYVLVSSLAEQQPRTTHLSLGSQPGTMIVTWSSLAASPATSAAVEFGVSASPGALTSKAVASTELLSNNSPAKKGDPGTISPPASGWRNISIHKATLTKLEPGESYFFRTVMNATADGQLLSFTYSIPHGRKGPVTFAVFGDMGIKEQDGANYTLSRLKEHLDKNRRGDSNGTKNLRIRLHSEHLSAPAPGPAPGFDAVLHVGDMAYDMRENFGRTGDEFLADMLPIASRVPCKSRCDKCYNFMFI